MKTPLRILPVLLALAASGTIFTSGCASTPTRQSTGEFIDDATITAKVKAELLKDPVVEGMQVNVDTFKGTVQLNGFVDTPEQKSRAEQIARTVAGVQSVQNKLSVKTNVAR